MSSELLIKQFEFFLILIGLSTIFELVDLKMEIRLVSKTSNGAIKDA